MPGRTCPIDGTAMRSLKVHGTYTAATVEMCPDCRGVFMDAGELGQVLNADKPVAGAPARDAPDRDLTCPSCSGEMTVRDVEGVPLDQCGDCASLWLDRGELAKVQAHVRKARDEQAELAAEGRAARLYDAITSLE